MIGLVVRFRLRQGHEEAFDELIAETVRGIEGEPGTVCYVVNEARDAPNERIFFELYRDDTALDAHETAPHVQRFLAARRDHLAAEPEVTRVRAVSGTGIELGESGG
jgi:quinol monooxygenase YgiN